VYHPFLRRPLHRTCQHDRSVRSVWLHALGR
jgi:hypothetical protein